MHEPGHFQVPDVNLTVAALDLLSGLTEGLSSNVEQHAVASNAMQILHQSMQSTVPEIRQSSFIWLGDLTKHCFDLVHPYLRKVPVFTFKMVMSKFNVKLILISSGFYANLDYKSGP